MPHTCARSTSVRRPGRNSMCRSVWTTTWPGPGHPRSRPSPESAQQIPDRTGKALGRGLRPAQGNRRSGGEAPRCSPSADPTAMTGIGSGPRPGSCSKSGRLRIPQLRAPSQQCRAWPRGPRARRLRAAGNTSAGPQPPTQTRDVRGHRLPCLRGPKSRAYCQRQRSGAEATASRRAAWPGAAATSCTPRLKGRPPPTTPSKPRGSSTAVIRTRPAAAGHAQGVTPSGSVCDSTSALRPSSTTRSARYEVGAAERPRAPTDALRHGAVAEPAGSRRCRRGSTRSSNIDHRHIARHCRRGRGCGRRSRCGCRCNCRFRCRSGCRSDCRRRRGGHDTWNFRTANDDVRRTRSKCRELRAINAEDAGVGALNRTHGYVRFAQAKWVADFHRDVWAIWSTVLTCTSDTQGDDVGFILQ